MLTELTNFMQAWLAFALVLTAQIVLVLLLRKPVRAWLGAVACYRLWLLPLLWLPFYLAGPALLAGLASLNIATEQNNSQYQDALQQFMQFELLPFNVGATDNPELAASGQAASYGWTVLALLWLAGTVVLIAWQGRRWLDFSRQVSKDALPLSPLELEQSGAVAHFDAKVPVRSFHDVGSAALFGIFKPVLLVPECFCQRYDSNQRHIILAHEAVHLRRMDNLWNLCALLLLALFWINPLVFIAWRFFRLDQELSCDALALTTCNKEQQKRYARTLLDSLGSLTSIGVQPALSAWDNLRDIKERSLMIKQHLHTASRPLATLFSLLAMAVLGASLTITFAELVSPVAQAAELAQRTQVVQQAPQEVRQVAPAPLTVTQETPQVAQAPQPAAQEVQQAAQEVQQAAQEVQQVSQEVQQGAQEVQQVSQEVQQIAQEVQQVSQEVQQIAQEVQQVSQEAQQVAQEAQQSTEEAQQAAQEAQRVGQAPREQRGGQSRVRRPDEEAAREAGTIDRQTGGILSDAIEFLNMDKFVEARARLADLRLNRLSPFERSRYEQLMFSLDMHEKNYPGAFTHLQAAIDSGGLTPQEESMLRYQMAQLYMQVEKYAEAATALEAWIASELMPNPAAYYLLAVCHYQLKKFEEALGPAQKAVELARGNGNTPLEPWLQILAALYIELDQFDAAEAVVTELVELFPDKEAYRTQLEGLKLQNAQQ